MLLRFSFSNFRSFRDDQELSLVASALKSPIAALEVPGVPERVLPIAAIYGANASGKTNVIRALNFMAIAVKHSQTRWEPGDAVPLSPFFGRETKPSRFAVDFLIDGTRYHYGFVADSQAFLEEWLYAYPQNGRKQRWFQRSPSAPMVFGNKLPGDNKAIAKLTRNNSLFLSTAAQSNHPALSPLYGWIARSLLFVAEDRPAWLQGTVDSCSQKEFKASVVEMLRAADFGITDVNIKQQNAPEKVKEVIASVASSLDIKRIDLTSTLNRNTMRLVHQMGEVVAPLSLDQESRGTVAFLGLMLPVLSVLKAGGTLCIDELDSSLHPLLAIQLMKLFQQPSSRAQLIFNTHDTNLLSGDLLRRDQIWFTEKKADGSSTLYPLSHFSPRQNENMEVGYLQGRYGGVPFLNPERLATIAGRIDGTAQK